jgi:two-component system response regulator AtoC
VTLLLDEIGDMDVRLQAKLLQVLQDQEFLRLGARDVSRVDVRIIAATHRDLERAISARRFREDLYYRLNIVGVTVPPLRERKDEILILGRHFLKKYAPLDESDLPPRLHQVFLEYDWPGNVRELENVIRRFLIFRSVEVIAAELRRKTSSFVVPGVTDSDAETELEDRAAADSKPQLEDGAVNGSGNPTATNAYFDSPSAALSSTLAEVDEARKRAERETILTALNATLWNRKQAARLLKIDYKALLYKMKKLGIGERNPAA